MNVVGEVDDNFTGRPPFPKPPALYGEDSEKGSVLESEISRRGSRHSGHTIAGPRLPAALSLSGRHVLAPCSRLMRSPVTIL